jgi:hypothetical protein
MTISSLAKSIALEIADEIVINNIGVTHADAMAWLTDTDDGIEYLREEVRNRTRKRRSERSATIKTFNEVLADVDDADDDVPDDLLDRVQQMFDGKLSRGQALQWVRGNPTGRELHRHYIRNKGATMTTRQEDLRSIAKNHGPIKLAKMLVEDGNAHGITEGELTEMIGEHDRQPGETTAKCFARHFTAQTEDGMMLRKAISIAKAASMAETAYPFPHV